MARVLIDVDNVVGDFVSHLFAKLKELKVETPPPSCADCWDFFKFRFKSQAHEATLKLLSTENFWATMPLVLGAKQAIELLHLKGHEVVFVTAPWEDCVGWYWHRAAWIDRYLGKDYAVVATKHKYVVSGEVLIDDRPDNLQTWQKCQPGLSLLFDQLHNQTDQTFKRFNWAHTDLLLKYLQILDNEMIVSPDLFCFNRYKNVGLLDHS